MIVYYTEPPTMLQRKTMRHDTYKGMDATLT